ncbi:unnamed protein product [Dovyalis caffra]|uniref:Uncharacterized protein n=1 Tax=Dovyalis caffra TaxID=77055 RepID=A0AAV1SAP2_9ROSI|nr:unnamed protein product [Dovyalis caffra]
MIKKFSTVEGISAIPNSSDDNYVAQQDQMVDYKTAGDVGKVTEIRENVAHAVEKVGVAEKVSAKMADKLPSHGNLKIQLCYLKVDELKQEVSETVSEPFKYPEKLLDKEDNRECWMSCFRNHKIQIQKPISRKSKVGNSQHHPGTALCKKSKDVRVDKFEAVVETADRVADIVEEVAEEVGKVAEEVADHLPEGGNLEQVATFVENVAKETAKDANLVDELIEKVEELGNEVESVVEQDTENANGISKEAKD